MNPQNIYIGMRYVPKYMGAWNENTEYEPLSIVLGTDGNGYTSKKPVPAGTPTSNKDYWALTGSGNSVIDSVSEEVNSIKTNVTQNSQDIDSVSEEVNSIKTNVTQNSQDIETLKNFDKGYKTSKEVGLNGDGATDNSGIFSSLDANIPVSLMPGSYLISGNVTIPCTVQFLPGAKLVYNAATPGTNYCTVTFSKGFVEYGTQIFDTYIIPRVGSQNATPEINPAWYGVAENQTATNNDLALTWILSSAMDAKRINFAPGTYTFSNISQGTYFNAQEGAEILGNGAKFNGDITVPNITFNGVTFTGTISANRGNFKGCTFYGGSSISSSYGYLKVIDCTFIWMTNILVSTMGTNGYTLIEKCNIKRYATNLSTPFSLSDSNTNIIKDCVFNDLISESSMPHFSIQLDTTSNSRVTGCYMPTGKIVCACAENNLCYMLTANNAFSNMVGGSYQSKNKTITITGYALTGSNTTLSKGSSTPMQLELIKLYSDGTYENVGAPTEANVRVIGNNSEQTIYNGSGTLKIGSDETAKAIMLTYSGSDSNNMIASVVITIT